MAFPAICQQKCPSVGTLLLDPRKSEHLLPAGATRWWKYRQVLVACSLSVLVYQGTQMRNALVNLAKRRVSVLQASWVRVRDAPVGVAAHNSGRSLICDIRATPRQRFDIRVEFSLGDPPGENGWGCPEVSKQLKCRDAVVPCINFATYPHHNRLREQRIDPIEEHII